MKRKILLTVLISIIFAGCGKRCDDVSFTVNGRIENVKDSCILLFFKSNVDGSTSTIATDTLIDGRFAFTAEAETGVQYHIMVPLIGEFPSMAVDFYAEPGETIGIMGKDNLTKNWKVRSKGKEQKIYQSYLDEAADIFRELQILELECRNSGRSVEYLKLNKPLLAELDIIKQDWLKRQGTVSEPWMDLMMSASRGASLMKEEKNLEKLRKIWKDIDKDFKDSPKGRNISAALHPYGEPLAIGDTFPYESEAYDLEGNIHSLSEFKGKALLLYFGSYSCAPCKIAKKEMAKLVSSANPPAEVIGFNLDAEATWKLHGRKEPVLWHDFNELKGSYGLIRRFDTQGIPTFVIVSKEGKILDIWTGHKEGIIMERIKTVLQPKQ